MESIDFPSNQTSVIQTYKFNGEALQNTGVPCSTKSSEEAPSSFLKVTSVSKFDNDYFQSLLCGFGGFIIVNKNKFHNLVLSQQRAI